MMCWSRALMVPDSTTLMVKGPRLTVKVGTSCPDALPPLNTVSHTIPLPINMTITAAPSNPFLLSNTLWLFKLSFCFVIIYFPDAFPSHLSFHREASCCISREAYSRVSGYQVISMKGIGKSEYKETLLCPRIPWYPDNLISVFLLTIHSREHFTAKYRFISYFVSVADSQLRIWPELSRAFVPFSGFSRRALIWALFFCL